MKAQLHEYEAERLAALRSFDILDTPREAEFDDVVSLVASVCGAPIAVINLIDDGRQWFKAEVGLGVHETPIDSSLCAHAILQPGLFIVPDTTLDPRFCDNPLVTGEPRLRFYAGALLKTEEGLPLGTVCVLDYKPRTLDENQKALLRVMANQIMKTLELRRLVTIEHEGRLKAELLAKENAVLAREGDHRVMNSLQLVQSILSLQIRDSKSEDVKSSLEDARNRVLAIASVHRELHRSGSLEEVEISNFLVRICESLKLTAPSYITEIKTYSSHLMVPSDRASSIGLIVAELVTNSFKYAYHQGASGPVEVRFEKHPTGERTLSVTDHGNGPAAEFDLAESKGVGMRVVNALVRRMNGVFTLDRGPSRTTFALTFTDPGVLETA